MTRPHEVTRSLYKIDNFGLTQDSRKFSYLRFLHQTHVAVEPSRGPRRHDGDLGLVGEGTGHLQEAGLIFLDDLVKITINFGIGRGVKQVWF